MHGDETWARLRVLGTPGTSKAHLWACVGDADHPYVVFDFTADYTKAGPQKFLKGYKGYFHADALAQYEVQYGPGKVLHCCCWAHACRKFVAAFEGGDDRAEGVQAASAPTPITAAPSYARTGGEARQILAARDVLAVVDVEQLAHDASRDLMVLAARHPEMFR